MKNKILFIIFAFLMSCHTDSLYKKGSSVLPVLIINTYGSAISGKYKKSIQLNVITNLRARDIPSCLNNSMNSHNIKIKIRGHTSRKFSKKQYAVKIVDKKNKKIKASLLGLPPGSHWVLNGPYIDKSLMRNVLAFNLYRSMGRYAPRTRFVELFLNTTKSNVNESHYAGVYVLIEKIKRGKHRVNINKWDNAKPINKRGFIIKIDKPSGKEKYYRTKAQTRFLFHYPKEKKIKQWERTYIIEFMDRLEKALNHKNPQFFMNYNKYIDINSVIDYLLLNEALRNLDAFRSSTYLYFAKNGKLHFGPVWDFNISMGNYIFSYTGGWNAFYNKWIKKMLKDLVFVKKLIKRWKRLRATIFSDKYISELIDSMVKKLGNAVQRNFKKWQVLKINFFQKKVYNIKSYKEEIKTIKKWFVKRLKWMDENIHKVGIK